jgi:accessory gene regulator protein AgrB
LRILLPSLLVVLGIILIVIGVLYALGVVHWFTTPGVHYKHAILAIVLGILAFVAATFARRRR